MGNLIFFPKIPPILKLEVGFFSRKKKIQIFQNTRHFFHLNYISKKKTKKSENLFRSVGRELPPASPAVVRGGASQLGAPAFGTERARLVVQVERLRCIRLWHRTCKTSHSSSKAYVHTASAQNVQD